MPTVGFANRTLSARKSPRPYLCAEDMAEIETKGAAGKEMAITIGLSPLSETLWKDKANTEIVGDVSARLTWQDLTVMVTLAKGETQKVLDGLTGYAEPGGLTALMGPSGSGKSTLLDALAGRLATNAFHSGAILVNGRKTKLSFGTAAYVTQDDNLIGTLTVRETISYSACLRLPEKMPWSEKKELVEGTINEMGLQDCADTVIGNWHLRGVSGGEKRRVSIALEILTRPRLLFLDEPTSGLDSASAFFVTQTLRSLSRDGRTVIASIHQPSSEVFLLFDRLYLLSGGRAVYFGGTAEACEARGACASFVFGFVTFMSIGGFPSFVEDMKVFQRERLNGHYGVLAFVVSNTVSAMPFLLLITFISGTICYFMVRLHPGFVHYLFFVLALYASVTVVESLMMAIASVVPNFLMGIIIGAGIQGIFMLVSGFFRLPNDIPKPFWRYPMSYISFHFWAQQGQYQNDLRGLVFDNQVPGLPKISGEFILEYVFQIDTHRSKWTNLGVLFSMIVVYRIIFFFMIKISEDVTPWLRGYIARRRLRQKSVGIERRSLSFSLSSESDSGGRTDVSGSSA